MGGARSASSSARSAALRAAAGVVVCAVAVSASGQDAILTLGDDTTRVRPPVAFGPDFDGDGTGDVLVVGHTGGVRLHSAKTGALIRTFSSSALGFGASVAFSPDIDGDQIPDVIVGANSTGSSQNPPGQIIPMSGATGEALFPDQTSAGLLAQSRFGSFVAVLGDVTGDGVADYIGTGDGATNASPGSFRAFSGADGSGIDWLARTGENFTNLGQSLAVLGDVNGDFVPDFAVSAPGVGATGAGKGTVYWFSGSDGRTLRTLRGKAVDIGDTIGAAGDLDFDGKTDLAVSEDQVRRITVYSSRTGKPLRRFEPPEGQGSGFAGAIVGGRDVDRDGFADVAVASFTGPIRVFSGAPRTSPLVFTLPLTPAEASWEGVALVPDQDGDGFGDLLHGVLPNEARITRIVPELADAFTWAVALPRATADAAFVAAKGSFVVTLCATSQKVTVKCAGLPSDGTYTVQLETGPATDTFTDVGTLTVTTKGATLEVSGTTEPPAALGIATLADLTGRRVRVVDGSSATILEAVLGFPGPRATIKLKGALARTASTTFPKRKATLSYKLTPTTGGERLDLKVKGVPKGTELTLEIETGVGTGEFTVAGTFAGKFTRDSGRGDSLPLGAASYVDLRGRLVRISAGADVLFVGVMP